MTPLMRDIGEHLLNTTRERFVDQSAPEGTSWVPLRPATKRRSRDKVLTEHGFLRGNLTCQAGRDSGIVGSPSIYASVHQFGAEEGAFGSTAGGRPIPWGTIPARPFLGVSDDEEAEIVALVSDYVASALKR